MIWTRFWTTVEKILWWVERKATGGAHLALDMYVMGGMKGAWKEWMRRREIRRQYRNTPPHPYGPITVHWADHVVPTINSPTVTELLAGTDITAWAQGDDDID